MDIDAGSALLRKRPRRGQALAELAVCLGAVALVVGGLLAFADCILAGLDIERDLRCKAGVAAMGMTGSSAYSSRKATRTVEVPQIAADVVFRSGNPTIREEVHIPALTIENGAQATLQGFNTKE